MRLVRGWEKRNAPDATGGLRLSQARVYREIGEEDGLGDGREGEIRVKAPPGEVTVTWEDMGFPIRLSREAQAQSDAETARRIREEWGVVGGTNRIGHLYQELGTADVVDASAR